MKYHVKRMGEMFSPDAGRMNEAWKSAEKAVIGSWPWNKEKKHPEVEFRALWSAKRLHVRFHVREKRILARRTEFQSSVCRDSCVEFFVSSNGSKYFNFEINCIGTLLLEYGKSDERIKIPVKDAGSVRISTSLPRGEAIPAAMECPSHGYVVEYSIPFTLFGKYSRTGVPRAGDVWKGNFYKCADELPERQWGCWSPVNTERPDFHRPENFGDIVFAGM